MEKTYLLNTYIYIIVFLLGIVQTISAQLPSPALVGYWQNWHTTATPYIELDQVDNRYNVVNISFGIPINGTDYQIGFTPYQGTQAAFITDIQTLQSQGRKVLLSLGGANHPIKLDNTTERDAFASSVSGLINTYGFDGIDIDFEGSSLSVSGGTIANPADAHMVHLIDAIETIMTDYQTANSKKLLLTFAPETALVQGGQSNWSGFWGAYLPVLHALRDSIDLLHVQLYNSGSMYGIDGGIYTQGTADFIVAMTEATIQGFNVDRWSNQAGSFIGFPQEKIAIGLPTCSSAAGGFTDTTTVANAVRYLKGEGPKPGSYTLANTGGYPNLAGMMTWSINWDNVNTCNSTAGQFAENFERLFPASALPIDLLSFTATLDNKDQVVLKWHTVSEINNDYFEIERSNDGQTWQAISSIEGTGNSDQLIAYQYIDRQPLLGQSYYRLRQVDFDQKYSFSSIAPIFNQANSDCYIFPNPIREHFSLSTDCYDGIVDIQIRNSLGLLVLQTTSANGEYINIEHLASGVYYVYISDKVYKIIKTD